MPTEPTEEEIQIQVDRLSSTALSQKDKQAQLLRDLLKVSPDDPRGAKAIALKQLVSSLRETLKRYYRELRPDAPDRVAIEIPIGRGTNYRPLCSYRNTAKVVDVLSTFPEWPAEIVQKIENCQKKLVVCITGWSNLGAYLPAITDILRKDREVEVAFWNPKSDFARLRASNVDPDLLRNIITPNFKVFEKIKKQHPEQRLTIHACDGWGSVSLFWIDDLIYFSMYWVHTYTVHGPHFLVSAHSTTGRRLQQEYKAMIGVGNKATCRPLTFKTLPRKMKPK